MIQFKNYEHPFRNIMYKPQSAEAQQWAVTPLESWEDARIFGLNLLVYVSQQI